MTATPTLLGGYTPYSDHNPIPVSFARPLAANAQVGRGQFVTVSRSTGYAALNDGTAPNQICVGQGFPSELSDTATAAGNAYVRVHGSFFSGLVASTVTNDSFTDADYCTPFYIADENTPGKLSNHSGSNRSLGGLVFGLDAFSRPVLFSGAIAWLLARSAAQLDSTLGGWAKLAADTATGDIAAHTMVRNPVHGTISAIKITSSGTITASNSDYKEINVYKTDGANGTAVLVGSYNSTVGTTTGVGSLAANTPKAFLLSTVAGALDLLETDTLYCTVTHHGSSGVIVPECTITVIQKVQ
jgi:hypothetical protein